MPQNWMTRSPNVAFHTIFKCFLPQFYKTLPHQIFITTCSTSQLLDLIGVTYYTMFFCAFIHYVGKFLRGTPDDKGTSATF